MFIFLWMSSVLNSPHSGHSIGNIFPSSVGGGAHNLWQLMITDYFLEFLYVCLTKVLLETNNLISNKLWLYW